MTMSTTEHGHAGGNNKRKNPPSKTYRTWQAMKDRCLNPKASNYARYGGRGIAICERWLSFKNFLADMGEKPTAKHTIERNDNAGDYVPGNCRWATKKEQANNRDRNPLYKLTMIEAREIRRLRAEGMRTSDLCKRFKASGGSINAILKNWTFKE